MSDGPILFIKAIDPLVALEKFDPMDRPNTAASPILTAQEKYFSELVRSCGNASESYRRAYPKTAQRIGVKTLRVYASRLVKKLGLNSFVQQICAPASAEVRSNANQLNKPDKHTRRKLMGSEMVQYAKKQYELGSINEEELWSRVDSLSQRAIQETVRLQATSLLKQWYDIVAEDTKSNRLSNETIEDLLIAAIGELPNEKYLTVLRGIREKRYSIIRRRTEVIDTDKITDAYRKEAANV